MVKIKSYRVYRSAPGVSLVELMVALSLMAITATAAFQIMSLAETTLFGSRNELTSQQREEAVGSFIYEEFLSDNISLTAADNYSNDSTLPDNLNNIDMTIVPIFGNGGRYVNANPRCQLTSVADIAARSFSFAADCSALGTSPTLADRINDVTAAGAKATLAITNAGGRCTISEPIVNTGAGMTATAKVDDANCLQNGSGTAAPTGSEIIFPRFVTYSSADPARYYTSLIENITADTPGLNLTGPSNISTISGSTASITNVYLTALGPDEQATVTISTGNSLSRIIINGPGTATLQNDNSSAVTLIGDLEELRTALRTIRYTSPNGFFGNDTISIKAVSGAFTRYHTITGAVNPNCGGSTNTTAVRMDVGVVNPNTNMFVVNQYVTAISRTSNDTPAGYYGYCRNGDQLYGTSDGVKTTPTENCDTIAPAGTFINWTGKQRFGDNNSITTFLYEESDRYDRDRFSMFFMFEGISPTHCTTVSSLGTPEARRNEAQDNGWGMTHDDGKYFGMRPRTLSSGGYCHVNFKMDNIEEGRYMDNSSDPFTVVDDDGDHSVFIGDNGTPGEYNSYVVVRPTPDGAVVPLRLPNDATYSAMNIPPLSDYAQDADGDGNVNPRLQLLHWDSILNWRIWSVNDAQDNVVWRTIVVDSDNQTGTSAIQLRVTTSQRCT